MPETGIIVQVDQEIEAGDDYKHPPGDGYVIPVDQEIEAGDDYKHPPGDGWIVPVDQEIVWDTGPPLQRIENQADAPYGMRVAREMDADYVIGVFAANQADAPFAARVAADEQAGYAATVATELTATHGVRVASQEQARYQIGVFPAEQIEARHAIRVATDHLASHAVRVATEMTAVTGTRVATLQGADWSIGIFVAGQADAPFSARVAGDETAGYGAMVASNEFARYGLRLAAQGEGRHSIGEFRRNQTDAPFAIRTANLAEAPFAARTAAQTEALFANRIAQDVTARHSIGHYARAQVDAVYGVRVGADVEARQSIGYIRSAQEAASWSVLVAGMADAPYAMPLRNQVTAEWGLLVASHETSAWVDRITAAIEVPITDKLVAMMAARWAIRARIAQQVEASHAYTSPVAAQIEAVHSILDHNPVRSECLAIWTVLPAAAGFDAGVQAEMDHPKSTPVKLLMLNIGLAEGDYAWTGEIGIAQAFNFQRLSIDDPLSLTIGGEKYELLVDNKTASRSGVGAPELRAAVISKSATLTAPRAAPIERSWGQAIQARDAAEEAVGTTIDWQLLDWQIPGGRLAVYGAAPLEVVKTIAHAAGGVVETKTDGSLLVRHLFPVAVPDWGKVAPDHILTDTEHNLAVIESHRYRHRCDRVTVRGYQPQTGYLSMEVDDRQGGLNGGRTNFVPGATAGILVRAGPGIALSTVTSSAGNLHPAGTQTWQESHDLAFTGTDHAQLPKPVQALSSWIWLGANLGVLTLMPDGMTVQATGAGHALVRVTVTIAARGYRLTSPTDLGVDQFPIRLTAAGEDGEILGGGEVVAQRGAGNFPGEDISDPLLSGLPSMLSRGRAVIDGGEALQEMRLTCIFRPGVMPGHLVEVHGEMFGASWRGKVTSVQHAVTPDLVTTNLEVLRHVGN